MIISNWNKVVNDHDYVIHLGDVILGKDSELSSIMERLNGTKILCRGNHDHHSDVWYMERGFDFVCDYYIYNDLAFSHAPLTPLPYQTVKHKNREEGFIKQPVKLNIHGHFHRGEHRGQPGMPDSYYDHEYFEAMRHKYHLIQIEDKLRPQSLSQILSKYD